MCELLGMSANVPTDICFSFSGLLERGGRTGPHRDGWGIMFYEGLGCRSFKDPKPSCDSNVADLVKRYPIKSEVVVSHIRQANVGEVCLVNTHPFTRELWGQNWTYAHNGQLKDHTDRLVMPNDRYTPVGSTDSEWAFCWLLNKARENFGQKPQDNLVVFEYIASLCHEIDALGVYNLLITDGVYMLAYCSNNLHWITRRAPFGRATLIDADVTIDFQKETTPNDIVTVVATRPLTGDESWYQMKNKEYVVFKHGERVNSSADRDVNEKQTTV